MKALKFILPLVVITVFFVGCKQAASAPKTETFAISNRNKSNVAADAKLATASFQIDGMTCAIGCAKTIEKELNETKGVKSATVDFDKKTATVEYDTQQQSPEKLVQIVEKTGDGNTYKVSNLKNAADKAMIFDQDKEKPKSEKSKSAKKTATTPEKITKEEKPACCSGKKHCAMDEKKGTL